MAKLIHSVIDCGHRAHEKCFHPNRKHIVDCKPKGENNFPCNCPLPQGISYDSVKQLIKKIP